MSEPLATGEVLVAVTAMGLGAWFGHHSSEAIHTANCANDKVAIMSGERQEPLSPECQSQLQAAPDMHTITEWQTFAQNKTAESIPNLLASLAFIAGGALLTRDALKRTQQ